MIYLSSYLLGAFVVAVVGQVIVSWEEQHKVTTNNRADFVFMGMLWPILLVLVVAIGIGAVTIKWADFTARTLSEIWENTLRPRTEEELRQAAIRRDK